MRTIRLQCGENVDIAAFHCQSIETYLENEGVLEGSPKGFNRHILDRAANAMVETWRARKSILIMPMLPVLGGDDPESPNYREFLQQSLLPTYLLHAWLKNYDPGEPLADTTELVIAFFRHDVDQTIETMVAEAVYSLEWSKIAATVLSEWD